MGSWLGVRSPFEYVFKRTSPSTCLWSRSGTVCGRRLVGVGSYVGSGDCGILLEDGSWVWGREGFAGGDFTIEGGAITSGVSSGYVYDLTDPDLGDFGASVGDETLYVRPLAVDETVCIRVGDREWLDPVFVDTDLLLTGLVVSAGTVGVSRASGALKFSHEDIRRSDPGDVLFDRSWWRRRVYVDFIGGVCSELSSVSAGTVGVGTGIIPMGTDTASGMYLRPDGSGLNATGSSRGSGGRGYILPGSVLTVDSVDYVYGDGSGSWDFDPVTSVIEFGPSFSSSLGSAATFRSPDVCPRRDFGPDRLISDAVGIVDPVDSFRWYILGSEHELTVTSVSLVTTVLTALQSLSGGWSVVGGRLCLTGADASIRSPGLGFGTWTSNGFIPDSGVSVHGVSGAVVSVSTSLNVRSDSSVVFLPSVPLNSEAVFETPEGTILDPSSYVLRGGRVLWVHREDTEGEVLAGSDSFRVGSAGTEPDSVGSGFGGYLEVAPTGSSYEPLTSAVVESNGYAYPTVVAGTTVLSGSDGVADSTVYELGVVGAVVGDALKTGSGISFITHVSGTEVDTNGVLPESGSFEVIRGALPLTAALFAEPTFRIDPNFRVWSRVGVGGGLLSGFVIRDSDWTYPAACVRFGLGGSDLEILFPVTTDLGVIASTGLFVPVDTFLPYCRIGIGSVEYVPVIVSSFSLNPVGVEIRSGDGFLKFNSTLLSESGGARVLYHRRARTGVDAVSPGFADMDSDGRLYVRSSDVVVGAIAYAHQRVRASRVGSNGSVLLSSPLLPMDLLEAGYYPQGSTEYFQEFVPFIVRREAAVSVTPRKWTFNGESRTRVGTPVIMAGTEDLNYGSDRAFVSGNTIDTTEDVSDVRVSYAVLEAFGGETSFRLSRAPTLMTLTIPSGATSFDVPDTHDPLLDEGHGILVGDTLVLCEGFEVNGNVTTIYTTPFPRPEGTLTPEDPVRVRFTDRPIVFTATGIDVEPLSSGSTTVRFVGEVSAVTGSYLRLGSGYYRVDAVNGRELEISPPYANTGVSSPALSSRIYNVGDVVIGGPGIVSGTPEIWFEYRVLTSGVDYEVGSRGEVTLRSGLSLGSTLWFKGSLRGSLSPVIVGGVSIPYRYRARTWSYGAPDVVGALTARYETLESPTTTTSVIDLEDLVLSNPPTATELSLADTREALAGSVLSGIQQSLMGFRDSIEGVSTGSVDGYLRLGVETGGLWPRAGTFDPQDWVIRPRFLWGQGYSFRFETTDPFVPPEFAVLSGDTVSGPSITPLRLRELMGEQVQRRGHDVDDVIAIGRTAPTRSGTYRLVSTGIYRRLGSYHRYSRLFPQAPKIVTSTFPGDGANEFGDMGSYSESTNGMVIARAGNSVTGDLTFTTSVSVKPRRFRGVVLGSSLNGYAQEPLTSGRLTLLVSVVPPSRFPRVNGEPDPTRLVSGGGSVEDVSTGVPSRHVPPLSVGDELGTFVDGIETPLGSSLVLLGNRRGGVFVDAIYGGCFVTLKDANGNPVTSLYSSLGLDSGVATEVSSLIVVPPVGTNSSPSNPPTMQDLQNAAALGQYRQGLDFGLNVIEGALTDVTNGNAIGQNPVAPGQAIEGVAETSQQRVNPLRIPAVDGLTLTDAGEESPLGFYPSEIEALRTVMSSASTLAFGDTVDPPPPGYFVESRYPDEILDVVAEVGNGVLTMTPVTNPGSSVYPSPGHAGVGVLAEGDWMFSEVGSGLPNGSQGILEVGSVGTNVIEPPRFVCPLFGARAWQVSIVNAFGWISFPAFDKGLFVVEDAFGSSVITRLETGSISSTNLVLDDGSGGGILPVPVGGLNTFMADAGVGTILRWKLVRRPMNPLAPLPGDGVFEIAKSVVIEKLTHGPDILSCTFRVSGDNGSTWFSVVPGGLTFPEDAMVVETAIGDNFFDFSAFSMLNPSPAVLTTDGFYDFFVDATGVSNTAGVGTDRLTFRESMDFRTALPRGSVYPIDGGDGVAVTLATWDFSCDLTIPPATPVTVASSLNSITNINNGDEFTFLDRGTGVGSYSGGIGQLKVMGFEGRGNVPITGALPLSAAPTSRQDQSGVLLRATGTMGEFFPVGTTPQPRDNRIVGLSTIEGDLSRVVPGDLAVVRSADSDRVSTEYGTYVIRDVVVPTLGQQYRLGVLDIELVFPTVVETTLTSMTVDAIASVPSSIDRTGGTFSPRLVFPSSGRVFLILDPSKLASTNGQTYALSVYSAAYSSITGTTFEGLNDFRDGIGQVISSTAFMDTARGKLVSGFDVIPLNVRTPSHVTNTSAFGVRDLKFSRVFPSTTEVVRYTYGVDLDAVLTSDISVLAALKDSTPGAYPLSLASHEGIPLAIYLNSLDYPSLHDPLGFVGGPGGTFCMIPGDSIETVDLLDSPSYYGDAGIFLEPSSPTPVHDYGSASINASYNGNTLLTTGPRSLTTYTNVSSLVSSPDTARSIVSVEVRRPRRFHDLFGGSFSSLRKVYEIPRGRIQSIDDSDYRWSLTLDTVNSQNESDVFGDLTTNGVYPKVGDTLWVYNGDDFVCKTDVITVNRNIIDVESVDETISAGMTFELWSKRPSQEQLARMVVSSCFDVVLDVVASPISVVGGQVLTPNVLTDGDQDFSSVAAGDYIVVDPAGILSGPSGHANPPERGACASGDRGVTSGILTFVPGSPSNTDDNRGFYRIVSRTTDTLTTSASGSLIAGDRDSGDILVEGHAGYPTVHGSFVGPEGYEGQNDLRVTSLAGVGSSDPNSYTGTANSIGPFSYKVLRPKQHITRETAELILYLRERSLSILDTIGRAWSGGWSYDDFQKQAHILNVGSSTDPFVFSGNPSNLLLSAMLGEASVSPYINSRTSLSILDRRFFCGDNSLAVETPIDSIVPYGVPVLSLSDRIQTRHDADGLGDAIYDHLCRRLNQLTGTLVAYDRMVSNE
jgi:hypothetical protein